MNIKAEFSTHIEDSLTICLCQVDKFDCFDTDNIDQVNTNVVTLWQEIIYYNGQFPEIDIDMEDSQFKSNSLNHHNITTRFLELLIDEIVMSEEVITKVEYSCLSKNSQVIILCDIIQDQLPLNHLQKVMINKVLNHAILNKKNQCHHSSEQL